MVSLSHPHQRRVREVHRQVVQVATQNGLDADRAMVLAERVVARLVLATLDTERSGER